MYKGMPTALTAVMGMGMYAGGNGCPCCPETEEAENCWEEGTNAVALTFKPPDLPRVLGVVDCVIFGEAAGVALTSIGWTCC
jgi:hypothetical protein